MTKSIIEQAIQLLHRSQRDPELLDFLKNNGVKLPLPRPDRDTGSTSVCLLEEQYGGIMNLNFKIPNKKYRKAHGLMEGEMLFNRIGIHTTTIAEIPEIATIPGMLPYGLLANMTYAEVQKKLGPPAYIASSMMTSGTWIVDELYATFFFSEERDQPIKDTDPIIGITLRYKDKWEEIFD